MHTYTVHSVERITVSTVLLTLDLNEGESAFTYRAGQYAALSFYRHGRPTPARCFSIVSAPYQTGRLQFSMRSRGHFTRGIASLQPGDAVKVGGPFGGFVMTHPRDLKTVFMAGGIGITPFMSMIRQATADAYQSEIRLLYSCATQDDVPFYDELQQLQIANQHFRVLYFIGQGPTDKVMGGFVYSGRITPEIIDSIASSNYKDKSFFICGPPPFMKSMLKVLRSKGTPPPNLITEAFSQGPNRQTGKIRSWPFTMYSLGAVGMVAASFTIMVTDLIKTLPSGSLQTAKQQVAAGSVTGRQKDLDKLVNSFAVAANPAPVSRTLLAAPSPTTATTVATVAPTTTSTPKTVAQSTNIQTVTNSTTSTPAPVATTPTPIPTPTPTPTPPPPPICKTSPSGVKTCK